MRKLTIVFVGLVLTLGTAAQKNVNPTDSNNPFFNEYKTPFQVPPFDDIKQEHFLPAIEEGIRQQSAEIELIVTRRGVATFDNTILPYDNSGELLDKVSKVFSNLNGANTNPGMQKLAREISPKLTNHHDNIALNPKLFKKIKSVYDHRAARGLNADQLRVVEKIYNDFVRGGANLSVNEKKKLRTLNKELSKLSLQFGENVLAETNKNFRLVIDNKNDLDGCQQMLSKQQQFRLVKTTWLVNGALRFKNQVCYLFSSMPKTEIYAKSCTVDTLCVVTMTIVLTIRIL